jgi:hypothetical protein
MVSQIIAPDNSESIPATAVTYSDHSGKDALAEIVSMTADIKREITGTPSGMDPVSQEAVDKSLLERIIELGSLIGAEAEKNARFNQKASDNKNVQLLILDKQLEVIHKEYQEKWTAFTQAPKEEKNKVLFAATCTTAKLVKKMASQHLKIIKLNKYWAVESARIADAYVQILSNVRPLGGKLAVRKGSNPIAALIMSQTVEKHFPSDWIATSNSMKHVMKLTFTRHGGYYEPKDADGLLDEKGRQASIEVWEVPVEELPKTIELLSAGGHDVWVSDVPLWEDDGKQLAEVNFYSRFQEEDKFNIDGERVFLQEGEWLQGFIPAELDDVPDGEGQEGHYGDFRHGFLKGSEKDGLSPVLNIGFLHSPWQQRQTAYHEFMHHMQNIMPESVRRLERAFFIHKTTNEDGTRNPLEEVEDSIDGKTQSMVHYRAGSFVDNYMGREYPFSNDLEIITTGVEALFENAYGSLMGFGGFPADIEHRNFMLGLLAVT